MLLRLFTRACLAVLLGAPLLVGLACAVYSPEARTLLDRAVFALGGVLVTAAWTAMAVDAT